MPLNGANDASAASDQSGRQRNGMGRQAQAGASLPPSYLSALTTTANLTSTRRDLLDLSQ